MTERRRYSLPVDLADMAQLAERQLMGRAPLDDAMRAYLAKGGKLLDAGSKGARSNLVRNRSTGRVLLCCWTDCQRNGDKRIRASLPHPTPRWEGERLIYIFCCENHKAHWLAGHREAPR
jgi:hypothetical protein